jgi:hypothetical protein
MSADSELHARLELSLLQRDSLFTIAQDIGNKLNTEELLRLTAEWATRLAITPGLGEDVQISASLAAETLRRAVERLDSRVKQQATIDAVLTEVE